MKYKYHDENSPRGFVHLVFDLYGENAARALGGHLPLEPVTVEQYVREFNSPLHGGVAIKGVKSAVRRRLDILLRCGRNVRAHSSQPIWR